MSPDIKELSKTDLEQWCVENGHKPFRARQIMKWVYQHGADTFAEMSDISVSLRETLALAFSIARLPCLRASAASDGTKKYVFTLTDTRSIESVSSRWTRN